MTPNYKTYIPEGFSTITPYLFTENPQKLIEFLKLAFNAEELSRTLDDTGEIIRNSILKMGGSCFMISQAKGDFMGMRTALYLYVENPDEVQRLAVDHGAKELFAPMDMDYGDRQGGVVDPAGNYWWISKRLEKSGY